MKLSEVFGSLFVALLVIYVAWILLAQDSVKRIIRTCEPVYYSSKPFSSISKLFSDTASAAIEQFAMNREKDCRFVVYDIFYSGDTNKEKRNVVDEDEGTSTESESEAE